jgi:hypothetical protein
MRKLLLAVLGISVLIVACENKSPVGPEGPGGVTVTETTTSTTTTTSTPTTTSTTSTTTTVPGGASRRYMAFQPPPNIPADMTLFFELIFNGLSSLPRLLGARALLGATALEAEYRVTGVYVMGNGTVGDVSGTLGNSSNPLESGGTFSGKLTAKLPTCTAEREFSGNLSSQTLQWDGGQTLRDCAGSPLSFASLTMLRSGGEAPLPTTSVASTTSSTSTVAPTTSSTSTSTSTPTTSTTCSFSVFPTAIDAPTTGTPAGFSQQFQVNTGAGCGWTAVQQANTPWITGLAPLQGTGQTVVSFSVACYQDDSAPGVSRTATITVNGAVLTVRQAAGVRGTCSVVTAGPR